MTMDIALDLGALGRRLRPHLLLLVAVTAVLVACNLVVLGLVERSRAERDEQAASIASLKATNRSLTESTEKFDANRPVFNQIERRGFLSEPDLSEAERILRLSADANLVNQAAFSVDKAEILDLGRENGYTVTLRNLPVSIEIEALFDAHIFSYLDAVRNSLPGLVVIRSLTIDRVNATTTPIVREILEGPPDSRPTMLKAKVVLDWMTVSIEETSDAARRPR